VREHRRVLFENPIQLDLWTWAAAKQGEGGRKGGGAVAQVEQQVRQNVTNPGSDPENKIPWSIFDCVELAAIEFAIHNIETLRRRSEEREREREGR
jgi:hypothetical protein